MTKPTLRNIKPKSFTSVIKRDESDDDDDVDEIEIINEAPITTTTTTVVPTLNISGGSIINTPLNSKKQLEKELQELKKDTLGNILNVLKDTKKDTFETFQRFEFNFKEIFTFVKSALSVDNPITTFENFLVDCLIVLSGEFYFGIDSTIKSPSYNDFYNHYKNFGRFINEYIKIEYIEVVLKDRSVYEYLRSGVCGWYSKTRDKSIIRFIMIFGKFLTIESLDVIGESIITSSQPTSLFQIEFSTALLNSNSEFKNLVIGIISTPDLIESRIRNGQFTIVHSFQYDNVNEFLNAYNSSYQENENFKFHNLLLQPIFWCLVSIFNSTSILNYLTNHEDSILNWSKSQIKSTNSYSILSMSSKYFMWSTIHDYISCNKCEFNSKSLKGVLLPKNQNQQQFKVLYEVIGLQDLYLFNNSNNINSQQLVSQCIKFIQKLTDFSIFLSTEMPITNSTTYATFKTDPLIKYLETRYYLRNSHFNYNEVVTSSSGNNNSPNITTTSLVSKVMELNDPSILLAVLKNLTQNGCTLTRELIDEKSLLRIIHSPEYNSCLVTLYTYWTIPSKFLDSSISNSNVNSAGSIPYIFFTQSHLTLGFLLGIHNNITEQIDIRNWVNVAISSGLYSNEEVLFKKYPSLLTACSMSKFSRTLNIFEIQILLGHTESIQYIVREHIKIPSNDLIEIKNEELLLLFDYSIMKKKVVRTKESIQAELDLIEQEEKEKKKQKEINKKKQKIKDQSNKKKEKEKTKTSSPVKTPTTSTTPPKLKQQLFKESSLPSTPPPITTPPPLPITEEIIIKEIEKVEISKTIIPEFQIGKFRFSRDESNIIGRGSNGTLVFKGVWNDRIQVAVKQMQKAFNPHINKEIEVLIALTSNNCSNMIRYIDQEEDQMFVYLGLTLCTESLQDLMDGNRWKDFIENNTRLSSSSNSSTLSKEKRILELFLDIVNGISFLHSQDIVHNDLNPRNILIHNGKFMVSDLGLSKMQVETSYSFTMNAPSGQEGYHPIEVLLEKRKTKKVDIFSLGCILFYLLTNGNHPFGNNKLLRVANIIYDKSDLEPLKFNSPVATDLISLMISKDESKRPNIESIINHPLFWNSDKKIKFIESSLNLLKDPLNSQPKHNKLLNELSISNVPFLSKPWNQLIDPILIQHIGNKQNQLLLDTGKKVFIYQYDQVRDLVRCIRNTIQHYKEIERLIIHSSSSLKEEKEIALDCLKSPESILLYFESKFPDLLFHLYTQFKKSDFKTLDYFN